MITRWTLGFLSGVNLTGNIAGKPYRNLAGANTDVILGKVRTFCAQRPDEILMKAIEPMIIDFPVVKQ
ncbi:hypothetical protein ELH24_21835 [Rhizobium ruizarguesonis]|uniref:hypothetical protein n=1 Tax=Rhizobium ruizarguesonis TaxID=2081791 RepID=UPI0010322D0E|nr:hypothetical protein [Rhizobium ruizarguesonis]TBD01846.1 hypothetical protein ELH25_25555 [Rhizobium ruizarguesonis]TBD17992.1 hypothetical protein ELH24_21835 [Rhizobium ruizarguesonis]TBE99235.1 hypothetical protein ELG98_22950 [Rhizobium ruizarguesonis]